MKRDWHAIFPQLAAGGSTTGGVEALLDNASEITLPAKTTVFHQGDRCGNYLLLIEGNVKVMTRAENGREIVLYRLGPGDSCVLTTACLFSNSRYPAEGVTESGVTALAIPAREFNDAVQSLDAFRQFVFATFGDHLGSLITLVEAIAFGRLDSRLAAHLVRHAGPGDELRITHQELATELGTAREVISRQLKDLEGQGLVSLSRGGIRLLDRDVLTRLADGH